MGPSPDRNGACKQPEPFGRQCHDTAAAVAPPGPTNGMRAAVNVVLSISSSDATAPMSGSSGRLRDIINENCPLVSPLGRSASSERRASALAARCTCRQRHEIADHKRSSQMLGLLPVGYQDKAKITLISMYLPPPTHTHRIYIDINIWETILTHPSINYPTIWPYRVTRVGGYDNAQIPSCGILFVVGTISPRLARRLFRLRANPGMLG